jgi:hypothetical protein
MLELLDIDDFLIDTLFLPMAAVIAGALLLVQGIFSLLMWRRGEKTYFLKFISFLIAAIGLILAGIIFRIGYFSSEGLISVSAALVLIGIIGGGGIQIFIFVRDTWFRSEGVEKSSIKKKPKEAKGTEV